MSRPFKRFLLAAVFIFSGILLFQFVANPTEILGNNVGGYRNGETVLVMSKSLYEFIRPLQKGDVVEFKRPDMWMTGVASLVGFPGEEVEERTYYFSNEKVGQTVPAGYYAIHFEGSDYLRVLPETDVIGVVWFPLQ